ncbi:MULTISPECIES: polyprenyl synthetase family protein [unclassified Acinetobacter]|uniref:polyprenyl synthetase family protein n=1 Tax=unclassified Acinetobacter TaxID=196816 RepID=UPI0035B7989B
MTPPDSLQQAQQHILADLNTALDAFNIVSPLADAVRHAVLLGGKRVRPALVYAVAQLNGQQLSPAARRAAVAIELIHCYSLTHDDLPCMDNDALRRGQPTCHIAFGESTALLAGDILQSLAFEILTSQLFETQGVASVEIALRQVQILATASSKMVNGQVLDLQAEGKQIDQAQLENIHRNKTGALIQAAIMLGAVTHLKNTDFSISHLRQFGLALGLAFQVQDDILDITADSQTLGKTAGKDVQVQKSTYPALMGLDHAKQYALDLHHQAIAALEKLPYSATQLYELTEFLLLRKY